MIKYLACIVALILSMGGFSQTEIHELHFAKLQLSDSVSSKINFVELHTFNHVNSNSFSNSLINDYIYRGYFSEESKQASYDLQGDNNRLGAYLDYGFTFKHEVKNGLIYSLHVRDFNYRSMGFDSDLMKLALSGNKSFENQLVQLQDLNYNERSFQELGLGLEKYNKEKGLAYGGSISLLKTDYSRELLIRDASFFTDQDGKTVNITADISLRETGKSGLRATRFEGFGTSVNGFLLKELKNGNILEVAVNDLGFVSTKKSTSLFEKDTSVDIRGVDLLNSGSSGSSIANGVGIQEVFDIEEQQESYNYVLPFLIRANYTHHLTDRWAVLTGIHYRYDKNYIPRFFVKPSFSFNKETSRIAPLLSYGGFSAFDVGVSFYQKIRSGIYLTADVLYLESFLIPNQSASQGFNLGVYSKF